MLLENLQTVFLQKITILQEILSIFSFEMTL